MDGGDSTLRRHGFRVFLGSQFFGAFNDNFFKFSILGLVAVRHGEDLATRTALESAAQAFFAIPFILAAPWAGQLADRYSKSSLLVGFSALEIAVMLVGMLGFALGSLPILLGCILAMSVQSTFFGPAKYGWMAETVPRTSLARANGWVSMTVFFAAVLGQFLGFPFATVFEGSLGRGASGFVLVAVAGLFCATFIPKVAAVTPGLPMTRSPIKEIREVWAGVKSDTRLLYTILGTAHFYLLAALLQVVLLRYGSNVLGLGPWPTSLLVACTLVGLALGSLLAGRWSGQRIELGLIPLGGVAMSGAVILLANFNAQPLPPGAGLLVAFQGTWPSFLTVIVIGAAGGLFLVPLQALLQHHAPIAEKGRYLAFGNLCAFMGILLSAGLLGLFGFLGLSVPAMLAVAGVLSLVGTVGSLLLLPEAFIRLCGWILAHTIYRIRSEDLSRLPEKGAALVIANHVSWVDALILSACSTRRLRFLMYRPYYEWRPLHWLFKLMGVIPIASGDDPDVIQESLEEAGAILDEGRVVCIFAEGAVTRTGHLLPLRRGFQRIMGDRDIPIIPVHLDGLWGSIFSHEGGRLLWKMPKALPYPVTVHWGEPLPAQSTPEAVREAIQGLGAESWDLRRTTRRPLHITAFREGRRDWRPTLFTDEEEPLSRAMLCARSLALCRALRPRLSKAKRVGVLLSPGARAASAVMALLIDGRVPVMLDSDRDISSDGEESQVEAILAEGSAIPGLSAVIDLSPHEDMSRRLIWRWRLLLFFLPSFIVDRLVAGGRGSVDDEAGVVFSGAGGPALSLSHHHLLSNLRSLREAVAVDREDGVALPTTWTDPVGFSLGLWLPLVTGTRAAWAQAPGRARRYGNLIDRSRVTLLFARPAALHRLVVGSRPERLGTLRMATVYGGDLGEGLAAAFESRFGLRPLGGWVSDGGSVLTLNTPDIRGPGVFQKGSEVDSVGHPLPGVAIRVINREGHPVDLGQEGNLQVRGPVVLMGDSTETPSPKVWCSTGKWGQIDRNGFVSHVTHLPDTKEVRPAPDAVHRAVTAHCRGPETAVAILPSTADLPWRVVYESGSLDPAHVLAELILVYGQTPWIPRAEDMLEVEELPITGAGRRDYSALRDRWNAMEAEG